MERHEEVWKNGNKVHEQRTSRRSYQTRGVSVSEQKVYFGQRTRYLKQISEDGAVIGDARV